MNNVRIGAIAICAALGASAYFSLRDTHTIDEPAPRTIRAPVTPFAASGAPPVSSVGRSAERDPQAAAIGRMSAARALASDSDTTGLLAPAKTISELLDAFEADIGAEGEPIDREALGAALRADPALAAMLQSTGR